MSEKDAFEVTYRNGKRDGVKELANAILDRLVWFSSNRNDDEKFKLELKELVEEIIGE